MVSYNVNPSDVEAIAQELVLATKRLATSLENLHTAVGRFLQANSGQTLDAYASAQHLWNQAQSEMSQALLTGQRHLQEIVQTYRAADSRGAAAFGGW